MSDAGEISVVPSCVRVVVVVLEGGRVVLSSKGCRAVSNVGIAWVADVVGAVSVSGWGEIALPSSSTSSGTGAVWGQVKYTCDE